MSLAQNYNPYYNDFDPAKNFLQILFKPGVPVQARELTQLQSILQEQISRFAGYLFESGNAISGGGVSLTLCYTAVISPLYQGSLVDLTKHKGLTYTATGGKSGTIVDVDTELGRIYVETNDVVVFADLDVFTTSAGSFSIPSPRVTNRSWRVCVAAGVYFVNDRFIEVPDMCFIPFPFSQSFSGYAGLEFIEDVVTPKEDKSLNDPAKGTYGFSGAGADRLVYRVALKYYPTLADVPANFPCLVDFTPAGNAYTIKANTPFLDGPDYTQVSVTNPSSGAWSINVSGNTNATTPYSINLCSIADITTADFNNPAISKSILMTTDDGTICSAKQVPLELAIATTISAFCGGSAPANPVVGSYWFDSSSVPYVLRKRISTGWTDILVSDLNPLTRVNCTSGDNYSIGNGLWIADVGQTDIAVLNPCTVVPIDSIQLADAVANPDHITMTVCHNDGTPALAGVNGSQLSSILNSSSLINGLMGSVTASDLILLTPGYGTVGVINTTAPLPPGRWLVIGTKTSNNYGLVPTTDNNLWEMIPQEGWWRSPAGIGTSSFFMGIGLTGASIAVPTNSSGDLCISCWAIRLNS